MTHVHLAHALIVRDGCVLLVASTYAGLDQPIWNLPGGRQRAGELLTETAERELFEETGLRGAAGELVYVNESYDGDRHFVAAIFRFETTVAGLRLPLDGDHVEAAAWVAPADLAARNMPDVVREPLTEYLRGALSAHYAGRHDAGISVRWIDEE